VCFDSDLVQRLARLGLGGEEAVNRLLLCQGGEGVGDRVARGGGKGARPLGIAGWRCRHTVRHGRKGVPSQNYKEIQPNEASVSSVPHRQRESEKETQARALHSAEDSDTMMGTSAKQGHACMRR